MIPPSHHKPRLSPPDPKVEFRHVRAEGTPASRRDDRGCLVSGASATALQSFERALAASLGWRPGAEVHLADALQESPDFVMAHAMQAYLLASGRDPRGVRTARAVLKRTTDLPANERERLHLAALGAIVADDYEKAKALLGELLRQYPLDALALHVAHSLDHFTGDIARLRDRVAAVLPVWSRDLPGFHAVSAMHAFGLEENGQHERAEQAALAVLDLNPDDKRVHHVMAHVFEMTDRADAGVRWMTSRRAHWSRDNLAQAHCWWHLALFHLALGQTGQALAVYDERLRAARSADIADLIDAAALLWRIRLSGADRGESDPRWAELATAWSPHIDDKFCSFSDLHAMLAFVGARDDGRASRLEQALSLEQTMPTRHGKSTRDVGLPACRALMAFGRGDNVLATTLLASLSPLAHRLGGSHAQRDVLHLTLVEAVARTRRPVRRQAAAA
jgi:tetratricopeptide (TPR) repeat protein